MKRSVNLKNIASAILFLLFSPLLSVAQQANYPPAAMVNSQQRQLTSKVNQQEYELYISLPDGYAESDTTYPVLYITDANTYFGMLADMTRNLQWGGEMPETIIVGIGYPISNYATDDERWGKWLAWRMRDFTSTNNAQLDASFGIDNIKSGRADDFLKFLDSELFPFIEKEYKAKSTDRTYTGFSLGGLFGFYALLKKPELFQNYMLGSASIWYDDKVILKTEKAYSESHKDLVAHVFMSAGELEEEVNAGMVRNMLELNSILKSRNYSSFKSKAVVLEGETHMSAPAVCFQRGLRFLFRDK
ncbi:alpha/beta hydrolase [Fulvivirga ligni]|uniref:alpha/beta hydrolase n=1 Tax=Fulvivirga ligni TaxID=2904246 RepID=UPI001EEB5C62|nr:alpha/beta hydrolase-fold protein [Fulvivirga ligni]UII20468.1 hypothetical protein LVD16_21760 [Fulvivirga ligni]